MIQNIDKKYFWDGTKNISDDFIIRRMLEYATLPDIKKLPYDKVVDYLSRAKIDKFWCDEIRKKMFKFLLPYLSASNSWEEAVSLMLDQYFESMEPKKDKKH